MLTLSLFQPDALTISMINDGLKHAESFPITVGFFVLIAMLAGFFFWLLFRFYPAYLEQQEKNRVARETEGEKTRAHLADILAARDKKAGEAVDAERSAAKERHSEIVKEIGDSVEELHKKTDTTHRHLSLVLAKLGVSAVFAICLGLSFGIGVNIWRYTFDRPRILPATLVAETCNPACPNGEYCCGKSARGADHQGCCEEKSGTAGSSPGATSVTCVEPKREEEQRRTKVRTDEPKPLSFGDNKQFALSAFADAGCSRRRGCL